MQLQEFIVVDDDYISGLLNRHALEGLMTPVSIRSFQDPVDCLEHIRRTPQPADRLVCILLDINMPKLSGWEFLAELEKLPKEIQRHYGIVVVTSSDHPNDLAEADRHPMVRGYRTKPISTAALRALLGEATPNANA